MDTRATSGARALSATDEAVDRLKERDKERSERVFGWPEVFGGAHQAGDQGVRGNVGSYQQDTPFMMS